MGYDGENEQEEITMFRENLKNLRRAKGLSQEQLAQRLHVVRQTISKWEKGLSVPDADLLIQLAGIFDTTVGELLGGPVEAPADAGIIAEKLEQINLQLAQRNNRSRRVWKIVAGVLIFFAAVTIICVILSLSAHQSYETKESAEIIRQLPMVLEHGSV